MVKLVSPSNLSIELVLKIIQSMAKKSDCNLRMILNDVKTPSKQIFMVVKDVIHVVRRDILQGSVIVEMV